MKRIFGIAIACATTLMFACTNDENITATEIGLEDVEIESTAESLFDDIDNTADEALSLSSIAGGRVGPGKNIPDCAVVTHDEANGTITIDFGDGCEGRNGVVKKGVIAITYSGDRGTPGSFKTVTFQDFYVDSLHIEGTRSWQNISESEESNPTYSITLTGGKITFADGTFMTRETSHVKTMFLNEEDNSLNESTLSGSASGTNLEGLAYSHVIDAVTPLLFKSACKEDRVFAPVSGILVINVEGESEKVVDFGDGTCDNLATVTQDGVSEEKEINAKRKRKGFAKRRRG